MRLRSWRAIAVLLLVVGVGGCDGSDPAAPVRIAPDWHEVHVPMPPGASGRIALRDAASCAGAWYVVGAVLGDDGASRPAAWTSADGHTWESVPIDASGGYAGQAILRSVACRDGRMAAVGSRSGGAHGNPRTTSWYQRPDGTLVDMQATWILYGGAAAVSVNRIAAGPDGWLIDGNRRSGAAVWISPDATDFRLIDDDRALSSDPDHATAALDQTHDGTAWTVVGRVETPGRVSPAPMAWTSTDGAQWTREPVPAGTDGFGDLERVIPDHGGVLAAGVRGHRFGTWLRTGGRWHTGDAFGAVVNGATQPPFVSGLAEADDTVLATVSDGVRFRMWSRHGAGPWREVRLPTRPRSTGDTQLTVATHGARTLLVSDDGTSGRAWVTDWNTLSR